MKHNKFSKFIEHILVCLPLLFLGITSAYVVFNKNAKDSFSGELTYKETFSLKDYAIGNNLQLNSFTYDSNTNYYYDIDIFKGSIYTFDIPFGNNQYLAYGFNAKSIQFTNGNQLISYDNSFVLFSLNRNNVAYGTAVMYIYENNLFDISNSYILNQYDYFAKYYKNGTLQSASASYYYGFRDLEFVGYDNNIYFTNNNIVYLYPVIDSYLTNITLSTGVLNNVLEISMNRFNKLGFGKIPFTSFFTSIFMNGETNVYVEFVNSYLNYFLFVEATYFLPMVIYWFIHFGERLVDKFSNKEF